MTKFLAHCRTDFPILSQRIRRDQPLVYLDNAASTQRPDAVLAAMDCCYRKYYANVHRGIHHLSEQASEYYEQARETVRALINAPSREEVIFTGGTTAAINLVAHSLSQLRMNSGDEILLTIFDHHSNIVPWQQAAERTGSKVNFCPLGEDGQFDMDIWKSMLNERTRVVAFPAVSNVLGDALPVAELVSFARGHNSLSVVDAAQLAPHEPLDVQRWQADFVAFSGHKMLGPTGIGVLFGRRDLLEQMPPFMGGGSMINSVTVDGFVVGELPAKFEAGTPPIAEAIGLAEAIRYLEKWDISTIAQHERSLANLCRTQLAAIDGLRFLSTKEQPDSGIVSFSIDQLSPQDISLFLDRKGIAVRAGHHCAMPLHDALNLKSSLRASFYLYNTEEEVQFFAETLTSIVKKLRD